MPTATVIPNTSSRLAQVLDSTNEEIADDGSTKEDLVRLLTTLWKGGGSPGSDNSSEELSLNLSSSDKSSILNEYNYIKSVHEKEEAWRNREATEDINDLEDEHEITDFARKLVAMCKYAPMRLSAAERQVFNLLQSALSVSEYSDRVDIIHRGGSGCKEEVIRQEMLNICSIVSGLVCSHSLEKAQRLIFKGVNINKKGGGSGDTSNSMSLADNAGIYKRVFELGRRAKLSNPDLMRSSYGKLLFILQDSRVYYGRLGSGNFELTGLYDNNGNGGPSNSSYSTDSDILTVHSFLLKMHREDAEMFLKEPLLRTAIAEINESKLDNTTSSDGNNSTTAASSTEPIIDPVFGTELRTREQINAAKKKKEEAVDYMKKKYGRRTEAEGRGIGGITDVEGVGDLLTRYLEDEEELQEQRNGVTDNNGTTAVTKKRPMLKMTCEQVELVLKSLQDYYALLKMAEAPLIRIISLMEKYFDPRGPTNTNGTINMVDAPSDLSIRSGQEGSCLSHSHQVQYLFCSQSLTLWKNIMGRLPELFQAAENDTLNQRYQLRDTGQGLNRLQNCPMVGKLMSKILGQTQQECSRKGQQWVGLSVVHLGDRDVPNSLFFIDKYCQVPKIIGPIVMVLDKIPLLYYGTGNGSNANEKIKSIIDEFGGPENVIKVILRDFLRHGFDGSGDDGGSCVDGRLTSAWNWCSRLEKKNYFPVFLLCGWQGFDG